MVTNKLLPIEIAYALPAKQTILKIEVAESSTIAEAIQQSGILSLFPEIDLLKQKVGIFGQWRQLTDKVQPGDRIEIYRALTIDPKEARRVRERVKG